jgi:hypothetical protein
MFKPMRCSSRWRDASSEPPAGAGPDPFVRFCTDIATDIRHPQFAESYLPVIALLKGVNKPEIPHGSRISPDSRVEAVLSGPMRIRIIATTASAFLVSLLLAAPALADKGGEGLYGKTNDKVVTNFGFGLMIFFTLLVTILSIGQYLLDRRKQSK